MGTFQFDNVTADHTIDIGTEAVTPVFHTITATADQGASITPGGAVQVVDGGSQAFEWSANPGFKVVRVTIDGVDHPELV